MIRSIPAGGRAGFDVAMRNLMSWLDLPANRSPGKTWMIVPFAAHSAVLTDGRLRACREERVDQS